MALQYVLFSYLGVTYRETADDRRLISEKRPEPETGSPPGLSDFREAPGAGNPVLCMRMGISEVLRHPMTFQKAIEISAQTLHRIRGVHLLLELVPAWNFICIVIHSYRMFRRWSEAWNFGAGFRQSWLHLARLNRDPSSPTLFGNLRHPVVDSPPYAAFDPHSGNTHRNRHPGARRVLLGTFRYQGQRWRQQYPGAKDNCRCEDRYGYY